MKWFGYLLAFFSTVCGIEAQYGWPPSQTNTYAVVGSDEVGFYLPLADYQLKKQAWAVDGIACLNYYESLVEPQKSCIFLYDPFDGPIEVLDFAKWCLANENFLDLPQFNSEAEMIDSGSFYAGADRKVHFLFTVIDYRDRCFIEFFFTHKNNGYALIASCKKGDLAAVEAWREFFSRAVLHLECFEPKK